MGQITPQGIVYRSVDCPVFLTEQAVVDVTQLEKLWHKGPDFEKDGAAIPLVFRVATVEDKRPPPGTHTTRRLWQASTGKVSLTQAWLCVAQSAGCTLTWWSWPTAAVRCLPKLREAVRQPARTSAVHHSCGAGPRQVCAACQS